MENNTSPNIDAVVGQIHIGLRKLPLEELAMAGEAIAASMASLYGVGDSNSEHLQAARETVSRAYTHITAASAAVEGAKVYLNAYLQDYVGANGSETNVAVATAKKVIYEQPGATKTFYDIGVDGIIRPCDPPSGAVIRPGEVPPSLMSDPELREGFEFWQRYGHEIRFRFLGTAHATAEQLNEWGINLRAEAQRLAVSGGVLFLEGFAGKDIFRSAQELYTIAAALPPDKQIPFVDLLEGLSQKNPNFRYAAAVVRNIMGTGVTTTCADYIMGGDRPGDKALTALHEASKDAEVFQADKPQLATIIEKISLDVVYDMYRDMHFIGRMGAKLAEAHQPGTVTETAWLGGAMHETIGRHLAAKGVAVAYAHDRTKLTSFNEHMLRCIQHGEISPRDIREFLTQLP
jgi:hypothetical protein